MLFIPYKNKSCLDSCKQRVEVVYRGRCAVVDASPSNPLRYLGKRKIYELAFLPYVSGRQIVLSVVRAARLSP